MINAMQVVLPTMGGGRSLIQNCWQLQQSVVSNDLTKVAFLANLIRFLNLLNFILIPYLERECSVEDSDACHL